MDDDLTQYEITIGTLDGNRITRTVTGTYEANQARSAFERGEVITIPSGGASDVRTHINARHVVNMTVVRAEQG